MDIDPNVVYSYGDQYLELYKSKLDLNDESLKIKIWNTYVIGCLYT